MPSTRARAVVAVGLAVKPVGKPDAGNPHVRFDERGRETGCCRMAQATAPVLDSTDQGQEASCPGRHPRPAAPGHRPCRGHSGPRGWRSAHGHPVRPASFPAEALRRRRISRTAVPGRLTPDHAPRRRGDCEAFGCRGFTVLPRRWIVERTIAWLNRCRRLAKDWECLNRKALAFLRLASIRLMLRKLCQTSK